MNETNSIPSASKALDALVQISDRIYGLPVFALVVVICVCAGYMLKAMPFKFARNDMIPVWVVCLGVIGETVLGLPCTVWAAAKNAFVGIIAGAMSKIIYDNLLKRFESPNQQTQPSESEKKT